MGKINNVIDNVVKKTLYVKLISKVNTIDSSKLVLKTQYHTDKSSLQENTDDADKKISDTSGLLKQQIITQKLLRWKVKYLVLLVWLLLVILMPLKTGYPTSVI